MGGQIPNWQGFLNQKISALKPDFNWASAQGQFDARQQSTTIAGTAPTQAAASLYESQFGPVNQLKAQMQTVDQYGNLLLSSMQGINPTVFSAANTTIGNVQRHLTSQQRALYDNTLATLQSSVANLLSTNGSGLPTDIANKANMVISGTLPVSQLQALLQRINEEGNIRLGAQAGVLNVGAQGIGAKQQNYNVPYEGPLQVGNQVFIKGSDGKYYAQ